MAADAPDFVIQAAYRACIKKFHPDHYNEPDARQKTADILEAYRLIGTHEARAEFDGARGSRRGSPPPTPPQDHPVSPKPEPDPGSEPVQSPRTAFPSWLVPILAAVPLGVAVVINALSGPEGRLPPVTTTEDISRANDVVEGSDVVEQEASLPNLDDILSFTNPSECEMASATAKLFDNLMIFDPPDYVGRRGPPVNLPNFDRPILPTFSRTVDTREGRNVRDNEATLSIAGTWHGLKVSKIRVRAMEQSSFWEQQIRFFEPPSQVRATLNEMGFDIPPVGDFREFTGADVVSAGIGVEQIPGGSALYCGSSIYY